MSLAILYEDSGELGNRLVSYSYLLSFGARHRARVANLCFWRYAHLFAPASETQADKRHHVQGAGERAIRSLLDLPPLARFRRRFQFDGDLVCSPRALGIRALNAVASRWARPLSRAIPLTVRHETSWAHHCSLAVSRPLADLPIFEPEVLMENAAQLRARFALRADLDAQLTSWLQPLRENCDRLIGVHVRRGDYAVYRGGCWFFDHSTYRRLMSHLVTVYAPERVAFVLASAEPFEPGHWAGLPVHPAPGMPILDMYALARCSLIVGPPSTFSGWASFAGDTPVYFIEHAADTPARRDLLTVWTPRFY